MAVKKSFTKMQCPVCKRVNYFVRKPKTIIEKKMESNKYCHWCKKHTNHKETKK